MKGRSGIPLMFVTLPAEVWGRIVLRAQESDDWGLRTLIEQAVHEAGSISANLDPPTTRPTGGSNV